MVARREFRGDLYVFVDKLTEAERIALASDHEDIFDQRKPGQLAWYLIGSAVGKSSRGSYCSRTSVSKLRKFSTFAEAMDYVRGRRKSRPLELFHLVYEMGGCKSIVTSLEQIQRLDGVLIDSEQGIPANDAEHESFALLASKVGKIVATNALILLRALAVEGEAVARDRFSGATYDRLWHVLLEAQLVDAAGNLIPASPQGQLRPA